MEAKASDHVWMLAERVGILQARGKALVGTEENKRGPYKKAGADSD